RDFLLYNVGWDKDADLNTVYGQTVEPLPFAAMERYPYGAAQDFPDTPTHREYLRTWQTRTQPEAAFWRSVLRWGPQTLQAGPRRPAWRSTVPDGEGRLRGPQRGLKPMLRSLHVRLSGPSCGGWSPSRRGPSATWPACGPSKCSSSSPRRSSPSSTSR